MQHNWIINLHIHWPVPVVDGLAEVGVLVVSILVPGSTVPVVVDFGSVDVVFSVSTVGFEEVGETVVSLVPRFNVSVVVENEGEGVGFTVSRVDGLGGKYVVASVPGLSILIVVEEEWVGVGFTVSIVDELAAEQEVSFDTGCTENENWVKFWYNNW